MTDSQLDKPGIQINTRQIMGGAILIGVGGVLALAGAAMAATALVAAYRDRVRQMEVPASVLARQQWDRARAAAVAGVGEWRNGRQPADAAS
jgi:hypothetical protein